MRLCTDQKFVVCIAVASTYTSGNKGTRLGIRKKAHHPTQARRIPHQVSCLWASVSSTNDEPGGIGLGLDPLQQSRSRLPSLPDMTGTNFPECLV